MENTQINLGKLPAFDLKLQKKWLGYIDAFNKQYMQVSVQNLKTFHDVSKTVQAASIDISQPGGSFPSALSSDEFEYIPANWQGVHYSESRMDPDTVSINFDKRFKSFIVRIDGNLLFSTKGSPADEEKSAGKVRITHNRYYIFWSSLQPSWKVFITPADSDDGEEGEQPAKTDGNNRLTGPHVVSLKSEPDLIIDGYPADPVSADYVKWKVTDLLGSIEELNHDLSRWEASKQYFTSGSRVSQKVISRFSGLKKQNLNMSISGCWILDWNQNGENLIITTEEIYHAYPTKSEGETKKVILQNQYDLKLQQPPGGGRDWLFRDMKELDRKEEPVKTLF
jgi:hypothetical protein